MIDVPPPVAVWAAKYGMNAVTAAGSVFYVLYKRSREKRKAPWASGHTGFQFFNGMAVVPLLLMAGAAFSDTMANLLLSTNGIILLAAAAVSLGVMLQDREA